MDQSPLPPNLLAIVQEYAVVGCQLKPGMDWNSCDLYFLSRNPHPVAIAYCLPYVSSDACMDRLTFFSHPFSSVVDFAIKYSVHRLNWSGFQRNLHPAAVAHCIQVHKLLPGYLDGRDFCRNTHPDAVAYCLANPRLKVLLKNINPAAVNSNLELEDLVPEIYWANPNIFVAPSLMQLYK